MHLVLNMFIFTRTLVTNARTIIKPRCYLNFQRMCPQADLLPLRITCLDITRWRYRGTFFFFFGWCYSYGPQQGPDRQQKKRGERAQAQEKAKGSCSRRPRTKERKPGKRKKTQVEYRVEGAQDRRRRRKPGGWKETPKHTKKGGRRT